MKGNRNSQITLRLVVFAALVIASFGVDVSIENADACSFPSWSVQCFAPQSPDAFSEAPGQPELLAVLAEHESYVEGGCGAAESSCTGSKYSTVTFTVADKRYDDFDPITALGLVVRTESDTDASREFEAQFRPFIDGGCESSNAVTGNGVQSAFDGDFDRRTQRLEFTTANLTASRFSGVRVSIAFVDQNGNVGEFSEPVELQRRARVIEP